MASEHTRQKRVRDENLRVLDEALASLRGLHARELDARIATQSKRLAEETRLYSVLEGRAVAEYLPAPASTRGLRDDAAGAGRRATALETNAQCAAPASPARGAPPRP